MNIIVKYGVPTIFALTGYTIFKNIYYQRINNKYCIRIDDFELMFNEVLLKQAGYIGFIVGGFFIGTYLNNKIFNNK